MQKLSKIIILQGKITKQKTLQVVVAQNPKFKQVFKYFFRPQIFSHAKNRIPNWWVEKKLGKRLVKFQKKKTIKNMSNNITTSQGVKVKFPQTNEYRRFNVCSFDELDKKCTEILASKYTLEKVFYAYEDEEKDQVSFEGEEEWGQALKFYNKERDYVLIQAVGKVTSKLEEVGNFVKDLPKRVEENIKKVVDGIVEVNVTDQVEKIIKPVEKKVIEIFKGEEPKKKQDISVHQEFACNSCKCTPIIGTRYRSLTKKDFDLCEECFKKVGVNADSFDVYKVPGKLERTYIPEDNDNQKYQVQLNLLKQMGFENREENLMYLKKFKGNIQLTVKEIVKNK